MSDLAAAAAAVGGPEELVMRSARARAAAAGVPVEEILAAWAGGGAAPSAPAASPAPPPAETPAEPEEAAPAHEAAAEEAAPSPAAAAADVPSVTAEPSGPVVVVDQRRGAAPVLVGRKDNPLLYLAGIFVLFVVGAVVAVALPAADARAVAAGQIPGTTPELSEAAEEGRHVYLREGCFYCHTQQVRSVVTDVGLGPVTEPGTSPALPGDTFGFQRIGPDLTHVGSREPTDDPAFLSSFLSDPAGAVGGSSHPSYGYLSDGDLDNLVQYLSESK